MTAGRTPIHSARNLWGVAGVGFRSAVSCGKGPLYRCGRAVRTRAMVLTRTVARYPSSSSTVTRCWPTLRMRTSSQVPLERSMITTRPWSSSRRSCATCAWAGGAQASDTIVWVDSARNKRIHRDMTFPSPPAGGADQRTLRSRLTVEQHRCQRPGAASEPDTRDPCGRSTTPVAPVARWARRRTSVGGLPLGVAKAEPFVRLEPAKKNGKVPRHKRRESASCESHLSCIIALVTTNHCLRPVLFLVFYSPCCAEIMHRERVCVILALSLC